MGLENRDYIRDAPPPSGFGYGPGGYWGVKYLLIANIVVFVLQYATGYPHRPGMTERLDLRLAAKQSTTVSADGATFYEIELESGRPPKNLALRRHLAKEGLAVGSGADVKRVENATYADYSLVKWQGRFGLVRTELLSDAVTVAPLQSWQLLWRLITHGFCHGGFQHILFNMLALWIFGKYVEPIYGSREFLLFFLCGIVVAGLCHVGYQIISGHNASAVGASGGVMAVVVLGAMIFPRQQILFFGVIPLEFRVLAVGYICYDVIFGLFVSDGVAHWAHLGGAGFGAAYRHFDWRLSGFWIALRQRFASTRRAFRPRPRVRVYRPDEPEPRDADIDAQVDALLEKISKHGEASLTDKERSFLSEASRRYRKR